MLTTLLLILPLAASTALNIYLLYLAGTLIIENEDLEHRLAHAIEIEIDETTESTSE